MTTTEEMRVELYKRAREYVTEVSPGYGQEVITRHARDGVDSMINAAITAGADERTALENALGQNIRKLITVVITQ